MSGAHDAGGRVEPGEGGPQPSGALRVNEVRAKAAATGIGSEMPLDSVRRWSKRSSRATPSTVTGTSCGVTAFHRARRWRVLLRDITRRAQPGTKAVARAGPRAPPIR